MTKNLTKFENNNNLREKRVLSTSKAIIFTLPNMGLTAILAIVVFFTLLFYINIMGQPPIIVGIIYSITIMVYAVFCIIWGVIADKIGKKKVLLISGPILAISFIFIWLPPIPTTSYGEISLALIIWLIFFSFIFRITIAGFQPIIYSLLPELSTEEQNRIKISMINMIMMILGTVIGTLGPIVLMGDATKNLSREDPILYYSSSEVGRVIHSQIILFASLMSILFCICFILMLLFIKEPPKEKKERLSFKEIYKELAEPFRDANYRLFLLTFYLFWIPFIAFQYLVINVSTFVISLRGDEFILMAVVVFIFSAISFIGWKKVSEKYGLKETLSICLIFALISFLLFLLLIIPMPHEIILFMGIILISLCFCGLVGTMVFPFAIMSDIIDRAELKSGKKLSGSYSGAFVMMGSLGTATTLLILSGILEFFGAEASYGYIIILSIIGPSLLLVALIVFQKVQITLK